MYGKIFSTMFTGSMFGSGPVMFATMAYVIANMDEEGIVELNPLMLAVMIGTTPEEIEKAISTCCSPDPKSRSQEEEGRKLLHVESFMYWAVNSKKYTEIKNAETRRESNKLAQQKARAMKKQGASANVSSSQQESAQSAHIDKEVDKDVDVDKEKEEPNMDWLGGEPLFLEMEIPNFNDYHTLINLLKKKWNHHVSSPDTSKLMRPFNLSDEAYVEIKLAYETDPDYAETAWCSMEWVGFHRWDQDPPSGKYQKPYCPNAEWALSPSKGKVEAYATLMRGQINRERAAYEKRMASAAEPPVPPVKAKPHPESSQEGALALGSIDFTRFKLAKTPENIDLSPL